MYAVKENKTYKIKEQEKESFLKRGFDIVDEKGKIVENSPMKMVSYETYASIKAENEELSKELEKCKKELKKLKDEKGSSPDATAK